MRRVWLAPLGALLVAGCPGSHVRPTGPPPEYEKPVLPAWEAAAPVDPLESLGEGDWVDETGDEPDAAAEAGATGGQDAGAPDAAADDASGDAGADARAVRPGSRKPAPGS